MLEAVNSVIQSAPIVRGNTDQVSTADSYAANPQRIQKVPQAPYISPYIAIDGTKVVLQIRNPDTGAVLETYSSEAEVKTEVRDEARRTLQSLSYSKTSSSSISTRQHAAFTNAAASGTSRLGSNVTVFA